MKKQDGHSLGGALDVVGHIEITVQCERAVQTLAQLQPKWLKHTRYSTLNPNPNPNLTPITPTAWETYRKMPGKLLGKEERGMIN